MAELHEALKYLGPSDWSSIPQDEGSLDSYLSDVFDKAQLIVDSVPIPDPADAPIPSRQQEHNNAHKASEVSLSAERSRPPPFGHEKYKKEWGKPLKIKPHENPQGVSVYKMSGKDGHGAWFARSAVHEGIGFEKIKRSMQYEFEKSMAEKGPPGTGNVRGIGGEERLEDIERPNRGRVEVYHLSAQFPGPVAARDFVTLLITSSRAMKVDHKTDGKDAPLTAPRHYMIISKPCNHPKTQPSSSYVRGNYESIEFIREVPRRSKHSQSTVDLTKNGSVEKDLHNKALHGHDAQHRQRAATESVASSTDHNPEDNPVEWIMVTRSDPGGGIPRFLVDRGTPGSICGDVVKFLDWACGNVEFDHRHHDDHAGVVHGSANDKPPFRSWRSRSLVGVAEEHDNLLHAGDLPQPSNEATPRVSGELSKTSDISEKQDSQQSLLQTVAGSAAGLAATAAAVARPYTPDVVLNHLPGAAANKSQTTIPGEHELSQASTKTEPFPVVEDDAKSIASVTSYASAESFFSSEDDASVKSPSHSSKSKDSGHHEKELERLAKRKQSLHEKFAATQIKYEESHKKQLERNNGESQKHLEKYEKELKKHDDKYKRELQKIEKKQERERHKHELKKQKQIDKDEKHRLTRERDQAKQELDLVKKEAESLRNLVQELQRENTALVVQLGRAGLTADQVVKPFGESRSRTNSLSRRDTPASGRAASSVKSA